MNDSNDNIIAICHHYLKHKWISFNCRTLSELNSHINICRGKLGPHSKTPWFIEWVNNE